MINPEARKRLASLMEQRRVDLRLTWREVAEAGGISYEALRAARNGIGDIRTLTQAGIEEGLRWQRGSVARIFAGHDPVPRVTALADEARGDARILELAPVMAMKVEEYLPEIAGLAEAAADALGVKVPPGEAVFGAGAEADRWNKLVQLGWDMIPAEGFTLAQLVRAASVARVKDAERREGYGGNEAAVRLIRT